MHSQTGFARRPNPIQYPRNRTQLNSMNQIQQFINLPENRYQLSKYILNILRLEIEPYSQLCTFSEDSIH